MEAIDIKKMRCCEYIIPPKVNTHQEPYIIRWKCPKCGESMKQIINGSELLVDEIAKSIDTNKALPEA